MITRRYDHAELDVFDEIEKDCFPKHARSKRSETHAQLAEAEEADLLWISRDADQNIMGFLIAEDHEKYGTIHSVNVASKYRRQGVANHLVNLAIIELAKRGKNKVELFVASDNPAIVLYSRAGFQVKEWMKDYYTKGKPWMRMEIALPKVRRGVASLQP